MSKYRTKSWNCLVDLRDYLIRSRKEEVISFSGYQLVTNKASYGIVLGKLIVHEVEQPEPAPKPKAKKPATKKPAAKKKVAKVKKKPAEK